MAPITAVEILGELQKSTPDLQKLRDRIEEDVPAADRTAVFEGVAVKLAALQPTERTLVQKNLLELEKKTARNNARASLDALKIAVNSAPVAVPVAPAAAPVAPVKPEGLGTSVGNALEGVANTVLPQRMTANMSRNQKIAAVAVGTLGIAVAVAALWKGWKGVKKTLIWGGAAIAGGLGITWLVNKISLAGGLKAAGKQAMEEMQKQLDETRDMLAPWKKYGLEKDQYENAEEIYKNNKEEDASPRILAIFGGTRTPLYEKFMADMRLKHAPKMKDGIAYVRADVALDNYKTNIESAMQELVRVVENNPYTFVLGSVAAYRFGILQMIMRSGLSLFEKAVQIARMMGGFVRNHKLLSIFLLAGSALALREGIKKSKDVYLPENLSALTQVAAKDGELCIGSVDPGIQPAISSLMAEAKSVGVIAADFVGWASGQVGSFLKEVFENIPSAIQLTEDERILVRNMACIDTLRDRLKPLANNAGTAQAQRGMKEKYALAQRAIDDYEQTFILERMINKTTNTDAPVKALATLIAALKDIGVTMWVVNDIVRWKLDGTNEELDFSIDPSITNRERMLELSEHLYHGEWTIEYALRSASDYWRGQQRGSYFALLIDNVLYAVDLEHAGQYFIIPASMWFGINKPTGREAAASIAIGALNAVMFSISKEMIVSSKNAVIGGGPIMKGMVARNLKNLVPVWGQGRLIRDMYTTSQDAAYLLKFKSAGRGMNVICGRAGVRPSWIHIVETGDLKQLRRLSYWFVSVNDGMKMTEEQLRLSLRTEIIKRLNTVRTRDLTTFSGIKDGTSVIGEVEYKRYANMMAEYNGTGEKAVFSVTELLGSKTPLHAVLDIAESADDFDEIAKAYKVMQPAKKAEELKGLLNAHSVEMVRSLKLGESLDDVVKAVSSLDEVTRLSRIKELLIIGEAPEDLLRLGAKADDVLKAATTVSPDMLTRAQAAVKPAPVPAGVPGNTAPAPRPGSAVPERAPIAIEGKLAEMRKGFSGSAADVFDEAVKEARALGLVSNADECAELFKSHAVIEVLRSGSAEVKTALSTIAKGEGAILKAQSIAHYVLELGSGARGNLVSAQLLERVASVPPTRAAMIGKIFQKAPRLAGVAPDYLVKQFDAIGAHPKLFAGAVALEIAGVVFDYMEYSAVQDHIVKTTQKITGMIEGAKLPNGKAAFSKSGSGQNVVYTHVSAPDLQIDMSTMVNDNLESLDDAAIINLATSSASLATTVLAPSVALGPAGLVLAGCVIAVRIGTSIQDSAVKADLIRSLPLPILAKLGFAGAARGQDEFKWLEDASNWMLVANENERGEIRKRAYLAMFFQEFGAMQQKFPELREAVQGGKDDFEFYSEKGEFYTQHFPNVIQPYISMRIMDASNGNSNLNWGQLRQQAIKSEWDEWKGMVGLYADNVDKAVVGRILKESAWVYAAHIKEVNWHKKRVDNQDRYNASESAWQSYGVIDDPAIIGSSARAQIMRGQYQTELQQGSGGTLLGLSMNAFDASKYRGPYASQVSEMLRKQYAAFESELGEDGTRAAAAQAGLFTVTLPDGILPNRKERTVRLRNFSDLFIDTIDVMPGADKKARYRKILQESERIQALVTFDYKSALEGTFTEQKYNALLDFKKLILASPEFDADGQVINAINALPQGGWTMFRNGGNPAVIQGIDNALKRQTVRMKARYYEYFPEETVSQKTEFNVTLATFGVRADVRSYADTGDYSGAYDRVARKNIEKINDHLRHLSSTEMMTPSVDGTYYTREGHAGKYYPQENGTLYYIPDDTKKPHKIWALTADRKFWNWREATEGDRLHSVNPRFERELYVRVDGTGEPKRFEGIGTSGEYPITGGMLRYEESGGRVRWTIEGTGPKPHAYYCYHKNYLNVDQPGEWLEVNKIPDLVHTMKPAGTTFFYPQVIMDMTLVLRDGTEIKVAFGEPGGFDAMKPYMDFQRGKAPNYEGFDYRDGAWQKEPPSKDGVSGWLVTLKKDKREAIDRIEFTSRMSAIAGRKDVLVIPPANAPTQQPDPAFEQNRRNAILGEVLKTAPTIHRVNSGMYYEDGFTGAYWFENSGEFKRSWGIRNDEYVSPAVFRNGAWVELDDPLKQSHIDDMNERKAKRLEQEEKNKNTPPPSYDEVRPYDPAYEESLRKKDVKAELPLNEKVLLDDSFIAPRYEITVKLRNGATFEYWYTSKDNTYFAEGPKVNEMYSMDVKQKNARNENPFATPAELGLPLAKQQLFALDVEESKDEVTSFPTKKYFLTVKSAEVESIIVDDMLSKKTTYSVK